MRFLHPGRSSRGETHKSDPVSTRYRCLEMRSVTKRRPKLVVQTLTAVNACWWSFPAGGRGLGGAAAVVYGVRAAAGL